MTIASIGNMRAKAIAAKPEEVGTLIAFSPLTGEEYSANPGDYWDMQDKEVLLDSEGEPMILGRQVTNFVPA
jgi:hypothetical protein